MRNLNIVSLLEDGHDVVDAVNLWCVGECEVNVELSEDNVHLNDGKVVGKVSVVNDDVIDDAVVSQDVDVRVDAEVTRIVIVSPNVDVAPDVDRKVGSGVNFDDVVNVEVLPREMVVLISLWLILSKLR